jgi:ABC-type multidrug transport system fused ATPase/permease subunit
MATFVFTALTFRFHMTTYLTVQLRQELDIGLFKGFLELHISEMKDEAITLYFNEARRVVKEDAINMFTKQLTIFRKCTSILARITTLASLTERKSWPILSLTAALPLLDHLLGMIPWGDSREKRNRFFFDFESLNIEDYYQATRNARNTEVALASINRIARDINARPELLIFGAKDWLVERYTILSKAVAAYTEAGLLDWRQRDYLFSSQNIIPILHGGARSLLYLVVAYQPNYFGMPISQLSFLETSVESLFSSISNLRTTLSYSLIKDMFRIRNLFECIDITSKVSKPENPALYISHPYGMRIEVKDLTFRYGEDSPPVLKNINFTIEPGQMVSIVGYNGSGRYPITEAL